MRNIHRAGRPAHPMPPDEAKQLLTDYETMSTRQIAKQYGISQSAVCKRLKKARAQMGVMTE